MDNSAATVGDLLQKMQSQFARHNMEQADAEAVAIIAELLNCSRGKVLFERDTPLPQTIITQAHAVMQRRLQNEPWQYIFNRAYFRDLELYVDKNVLIPRPETEVLVDWCIKFLPENGSVLDLGTGSGAIALAIASERSDSRVTACDISTQALAVAEKNGKSQAPGKVEFLHSDLFSALSGRKFNIIAANLPYVTESEYTMLDLAVRDFEPKLALTGGDDGLDLIRSAITQAPGYLENRGAMILEMSEDQTAAAADFMQQMLCWEAIEIIRDYTGRCRFTAGRLRS